MTPQKTVFVGMSGGVDSSVAAHRLKKQGYNVVGVFIKVWHPDFMVCNWEQERLDAMRVAAHLEIPFLTCDAEEAYKRKVADYFVSEYKAGRTPNPDVMCNKFVKFGAFIEFAKDNGADYIATGHYAQKINNELHRGEDSEKDQTYFLWTLTQEQLDYSLFPVGDTPKAQIRQEAESAGIPVAEKKDSQGICFLGQVDIPDFLSHYIDLEPGNVLNTKGEVVGRHKGALVYTLGQRHGFSLITNTTSATPHYVVSRDIDENTITVDVNRPKIEESNTISLSNVILRAEISGRQLSAQFRYRQTPFSVDVSEGNNNQVGVTPKVTQDKPAKGQSCVIYDGSHCLGGGIVV